VHDPVLGCSDTLSISLEDMHGWITGHEVISPNLLIIAGDSTRNPLFLLSDSAS